MQKNSALKWVSAVLSIITAICTIAIIGFYNLGIVDPEDPQNSNPPAIVETTIADEEVEEATEMVEEETEASAEPVAAVEAPTDVTEEETEAAEEETEAAEETTVATSQDTEAEDEDESDKISFNITKMFSVIKDKTLNGNALAKDAKTGKITIIFVIHIILAILLLAAGIILMVLNGNAGKIVSVAASGLGLVLMAIVGFMSKNITVAVAVSGSDLVQNYALSLDWQYIVELVLLVATVAVSVIVLVQREDYNDFAMDEVYGGGYGVDQTTYVQTSVGGATSVLNPNENMNVFSGSVTCISGEYTGATFDIEPGQALNFGKDPSFSNIIFSSTSKYVSRRHCTVTFDINKNKYIIVDYSSNGTFIEGGVKLPKSEKVYIQRGAQIFLGNKSVCFVLN